jgi:hypothetical protein
MAKGQRSNREHKKPKQLKEKPTPAGSFSVTQPKLTGTLPAKKK